MFLNNVIKLIYINLIFLFVIMLNKRFTNAYTSPILSKYSIFLNLYRLSFWIVIDWAIDIMNCDCEAGGADEMNVINLNLTFIIFIRVVRSFIIFINWSTFVFINDDVNANVMFFEIKAFCFLVSFFWFRVNIISTDLMKGLIIVSIVDISISFKGFFWSRWIR